jgi:ribosomal protein S18 acetylase RimI-like enzyme
MPDEPGLADWADAAALVGPGGWLALAGNQAPLPAGWKTDFIGEGVQMVAKDVEGAADAEAVPLGPADVREMLDLTRRTKPGPFLQRTVELGTYLGIRRGAELVGMAGERLHPPGWTEISAVCTDPAWRGHGLASQLVLALCDQIRARGETPFLHCLASNVSAIRLYEGLGFHVRRSIGFLAAQVP